MNKQWAPSLEALRELQKRYGYDTAIAIAVGMSKQTVASRRKALDLPALGPVQKRKPTRVPLLSDKKYNARYKGRRYDDPENVTFKH
jgi:hypothetical protein